MSLVFNNRAQINTLELWLHAAFDIELKDRL